MTNRRDEEKEPHVRPDDDDDEAAGVLGCWGVGVLGWFFAQRKNTLLDAPWAICDDQLKTITPSFKKKEEEKRIQDEGRNASVSIDVVIEKSSQRLFYFITQTEYDEWNV